MAEKLDYENYRGTWFRAILYPEDAEHYTAFRVALDEHMYEYACILHDQDLREVSSDDVDEDGVFSDDGDGEFKKLHMHYVIHVPRKLTISQLSSETGLPGNYFRRCDNPNRALLYLLHFGWSDKHQYSLDDLQGTIIDKVRSLVEKRSEESLAVQITDFIISFDGYLSKEALTNYCFRNSLWSVYRRGYHIFSDLVFEHNIRFKDSAKRRSALQDLKNMRDRKEADFEVIQTLLPF